MVAIGIIAVLLAIAVPAMTGMLRTRKIESTKATMQTLETAIEFFADEDPLAGGATIECGGVPMPSTTLFGPYPPTPSAFLSNQSGCEKTSPRDDALNQDKMFSILDAYFGAELDDTDFSTGRHATIESLVFFLRRYSSSARDIIDGLPDAVRKDTDSASDLVVISGAPIELPEILDAWGRPIAYNVDTKFIFDSNLNETGRKHQWELRSAGEDNNFDPQFTDREGSDDVVLRGEWKER